MHQTSNQSSAVMAEPGAPLPAALLCPSAQPDWEGSVVIGVVDARTNAARILPLAEPIPVDPALLALTQTVRPAEIFRFAAPCAEGICAHLQQGLCTLAARTVQHLTPATERLPHCRIRPRCRWWNEQGIAACLRCSQVITEGYPDDESYLLAAAFPPTA